MFCRLEDGHNIIYNAHVHRFNWACTFNGSVHILIPDNLLKELIDCVFLLFRKLFVLKKLFNLIEHFYPIVRVCPAIAVQFFHAERCNIFSSQARHNHTTYQLYTVFCFDVEIVVHLLVQIFEHFDNLILKINRLQFLLLFR